MIPELRQKFNSQFTQARYKNFIKDLESVFGYKIEFRIAETPVFLPEDLKNELLKASDEILSFLQSDDYKKISDKVVPDDLRARPGGRGNPGNQSNDLRGAKSERERRP